MNEREFRALLRMCRELVVRALGERQVSTFEEKVSARFQARLASAPRFQQRGNRSLFYLGVPGLAIYRTLRDDFTMPQEPALELLGAMLERYMRKSRGSFLARLLGPALFKLRFLRERMREDFSTLGEPEGFRTTPAKADALLAFDVHECALLKYFTTQGAPEVVPLFCRLDDVAMEYVKGVKLIRSGTLARGASRCDFRYVRQEPGAHEPKV
jgi:hypothetical protein